MRPFVTWASASEKVGEFVTVGHWLSMVTGKQFALGVQVHQIHGEYFDIG